MGGGWRDGGRDHIYLNDLECLNGRSLDTVEEATFNDLMESSLSCRDANELAFLARKHMQD